jgi:hypothetical protein
LTVARFPVGGIVAVAVDAGVAVNVGVPTPPAADLSHAVSSRAKHANVMTKGRVNRNPPMCRLLIALAAHIATARFITA